MRKNKKRLSLARETIATLEKGFVQGGDDLPPGCVSQQDMSACVSCKTYRATCATDGCPTAGTGTGTINCPISWPASICHTDICVF